ELFDFSGKISAVVKSLFPDTTFFNELNRTSITSRGALCSYSLRSRLDHPIFTISFRRFTNLGYARGFFRLIPPAPVVFIGSAGKSSITFPSPEYRDCWDSSFRIFAQPVRVN